MVGPFIRNEIRYIVINLLMSQPRVYADVFSESRGGRKIVGLDGNNDLNRDVFDCVLHFISLCYVVDIKGESGIVETVDIVLSSGVEDGL
jgi:hypothetical protein